jgi:hypothetical protein
VFSFSRPFKDWPPDLTLVHTHVAFILHPINLHVPFAVFSSASLPQDFCRIHLFSMCSQTSSEAGGVYRV